MYVRCTYVRMYLYTFQSKDMWHKQAYRLFIKHNASRPVNSVQHVLDTEINDSILLNLSYRND